MIASRLTDHTTLSRGECFRERDLTLSGKLCKQEFRTGNKEEQGVKSKRVFSIKLAHNKNFQCRPGERLSAEKKSVYSFQ